VRITPIIISGIHAPTRTAMVRPEIHDFLRRVQEMAFPTAQLIIRHCANPDKDKGNQAPGNIMS